MEYRKTIIEELGQTLRLVNNQQCEDFIQYFTHDRRFFFAGAGRSGFAICGFAMRIMHMGYQAYFVGEPTTPSIGKNDVLVIASGSGNTASLVAMAQKAHQLGALVLLLTIDTASAIAQIADCVIQIPAPSPKVENAVDFTSVQPMGTLAEQTMSLIFDSLVLELMAKDNITSDEMFLRHANLE